LETYPISADRKFSIEIGYFADLKILNLGIVKKEQIGVRNIDTNHIAFA
jgi:hypothetical protein